MRKIRPWPFKSYVIWYHPVTKKTYKTWWYGARTNKKTKEIDNA
jgi:hypothetical protein